MAGAKRSVWVDLRRRGPLVRVCLPCGGSRASCSSNVEDEVGDAGCAALAAAAAGSAEVTRAVPIRPTPEPVVEAGTAAAQVEAGGGVEVGAEVDGAVVEAVAAEVGISGRSSLMAAEGAGSLVARLSASRSEVARAACACGAWSSQNFRLEASLRLHHREWLFCSSRCSANPTEMSSLVVLFKVYFQS